MAHLIRAEVSNDTDSLALLGIERNTRRQDSDDRETGPVFSDALRLDLVGTAPQRLARLEEQAISR